jgi:CopG family nickel-responsive transcriptional regulator
MNQETENLHKVEITTPDPGYEPFPVSIMNRSTYEVTEFDPSLGKPAAISYSLNKAGCIRVRIVHRKQPTLVIRTVQDWTQQPFGSYKLQWDGRDSSGNIVNNKTLFVLFQAKDQIGLRQHQDHPPKTCCDSLLSVTSKTDGGSLIILAVLKDNAPKLDTMKGCQVRYFMDYALVKTEKFDKDQTDFKASLDYTSLSKGKHLVTVNLDDLHDQVLRMNVMTADIAPAHTIRFGLSADARLIKKFDALISEKGYANRSEAVRDLMRDQLVEVSWADENEEVVGTLTLVYNHDARELTQQLSDLQHHHHRYIISSLHVHLNEHNCLEVLVVHGKGKELKQICDKLIGTKGVKHGKLVMSTTGHDLY